jgi:hypothetical protein
MWAGTWTGPNYKIRTINIAIAIEVAKCYVHSTRESGRECQEAAKQV